MGRKIEEGNDRRCIKQVSSISDGLAFGRTREFDGRTKGTGTQRSIWRRRMEGTRTRTKWNILRTLTLMEHTWNWSMVSTSSRGSSYRGWGLFAARDTDVEGNGNNVFTSSTPYFLPTYFLIYYSLLLTSYSLLLTAFSDSLLCTP